MNEVNPYAAPLGESVLNPEIIQSSGGIWRDGNQLVMYKGATLPDLCVHCNSPAGGRRLVRKLYWHSQWIYLLILVSLWIYIIVALIVRQKAVVAIGMCDRHYRRRLKSILAWWLITLACVALFWFGVTSKSPDVAPWAIAASVIVFLGNLFFAVAITRPVAPAKIDDQYVWLKKIHPDYLAAFPAVDHV
jgi:hypothetical protein